MKILCILILLYGSFIKADDFKIEKIVSENGIPTNLVYKIYQDSKGFIWFGTMYGLYQYNGVTYTSYRYSPYDSTTIGNDDVISIFEDSKGFIWFGTYMGGISRYDAKKSSFTRFIHNENTNSISDNTVWAITEDKSGAMWFGTQNGLNKFENNSFTVYRNINGNKQSNYIFSLAADNENNLWVGTLRGGLFRFNPERTKFDNYKRHDTSPDSINGNVIRGLYTDKKGNLWIGMVNRGLSLITTEDIKKNSFRFNKQLFDSTKENAPGNSTIYEISEDRIGNILFCSQYYLYKYTGNKFSKTNLSDKNKTPSEIVTMICDFSNCLWISSYGNCLYKVTRTNENFLNFSQDDKGESIGNVKTIFNDTDKNRILIGSEKGLFEFLELSGQIKKVILKTSLSSINSIAEDYTGNLLIGTDIGLLKISDKAEKYIFENVNVTNLILDGENIIAGTMNGLYFVNTRTDDTIIYKNIPGDANSLNDNFILSLYKDNNNTLWAGTFAGLNKFDREKKIFTHYTKSLNDTNSLSNNYVYSIAKKDENSMYFGTAGGINIFSDNKFTLFREGGLQNSVINSILPYKESLWLGTNRGLAKVNLNTSSVKVYNTEEGLETDIFNPSAILITKRGNILAGNKSGFTMFNPENLKTDTAKPIISFAGMKIYGDKKTESKDLSLLSGIELNYDQNNLEIDFALMDFNYPRKNQYEYKLEGSDENWIFSGNKNSVFYSNLNPGNYELKIRGINYNGVKSDEKIFKLTINPPFWRTFWFYCLVTLSIACIIFALYKYKLRKNIQFVLNLEHAKEQEREKWREQASIDYHDELGHKLTRISMYSRRILKKMNGSVLEYGSDINNIIETSNSLRMSARDLIWSLNPSEDSLFDFITRLNLFAEELFESSNIKYHKSENLNEWRDIELSMDTKRQMLFILKEGMNNSLKYSNAKNVKLDVKNENGFLSLEIYDDGIGFEYPSEYTGYGLLNMHKRAKRAGFSLEIISAHGEGTKIFIHKVKYCEQANKM